MHVQMLVAERGPLIFVFNFSPTIDREGYKVGVGEPGKYRIVLDSDDLQYGGLGRLNHEVDHFTSPEGIPGESSASQSC
jgi:1,4-alpha-glucan branching enzyme